MQRWIISDHHFGHYNIIKYCERPFQSLAKMEQHMIKMHNETVKKRDKVYFLGDFGLSKKEHLQEIISLLNGHLILILGNHDRRRSYNTWFELGFNEVYKNPIIIDNNFILSHEPTSLDKEGYFHNIHGHLHHYILDKDRYTNVCVEVVDYKPVGLDELVKTIRARSSENRALGYEPS